MVKKCSLPLFFFWLQYALACCGVSVPRPETEPGLQRRKCRILTTTPPGNSKSAVILVWEQRTLGVNGCILLFSATVNINSDNNDNPGLSRLDLCLCALSLKNVLNNSPPHKLNSLKGNQMISCGIFNLVSIGGLQRLTNLKFYEHFWGGNRFPVIFWHGMQDRPLVMRLFLLHSV